MNFMIISTDSVFVVFQGPKGDDGRMVSASVLSYLNLKNMTLGMAQKTCKLV